MTIRCVPLCRNSRKTGMAERYRLVPGASRALAAAVQAATWRTETACARWQATRVRLDRLCQKPVVS